MLHNRMAATTDRQQSLVIGGAALAGTSIATLLCSLQFSLLSAFLVSLQLGLVATFVAYREHVQVAITEAPGQARAGAVVATIRNVTAPMFNKPDPYIKNFPDLKTRMINLCDLVAQPAGNEPEHKWAVQLTQTRNDYSIQVQKFKTSDFFFRIVVDFEASAEETFDLIGDIAKRPDWDEICESAGVVEQVSAVTAIQV